jgi:uncharacterized membrane protein YbhN (UPF0104 family)
VLRGVRFALMLAALAALVVALVSQWGEVRGQLSQVTFVDLGAALLLILLGLCASMLGWRALLTDLGSPLSLRAATRVLFLGQLAKYLPGSSVWAIIAQTELARDYGVPRRRAAAAALVMNVVILGLGLLVALAALPQFLTTPDTPEVLQWTPLLVPLGLVLLAPPVLTRGCNLLLKLLRREPLEQGFSWSGLSRAAGAFLLTWLFFGLQIALLGWSLGADPLQIVLPSIGAFAAAWCAGLLVFVVPTGAGTREAVLTLALAPELPGGTAAALTIAVISRLLFTVADLVAAFIGFLLGRRRLRRLDDQQPGSPARQTDSSIDREIVD